MERETGELEVQMTDGRRGKVLKRTSSRVLARFADGEEEWVDLVSEIKTPESEVAIELIGESTPPREIGS